MFNIGGVQALKQHIFFEGKKVLGCAFRTDKSEWTGVNWQAILRCEVRPPIDVANCNYDKATGHGGTTLKSDGPRNVLSPSVISTAKPPLADIEHALTHFHKDFTNRPLSPSIVEDVLLGDSSARAVSGTVSPVGPDSKVGESEFEGFSFTSCPIQVSFAKMQSIQSAIADSVAKMERKRKERIRKEEEMVTNRSEQQQLQQRQRLLEQAKHKVTVVKKKLVENEKLKSKHDTESLKAQTNLEATQKKLRAVRKKIKETEALQEQLNSPQSRNKISSEQRDKLSRLPLLCQEMQELQREEERLSLLVPEPLTEEFLLSLARDKTEVSELETQMAILDMGDSAPVASHGVENVLEHAKIDCSPAAVATIVSPINAVQLMKRVQQEQIPEDSNPVVSTKMPAAAKEKASDKDIMVASNAWHRKPAVENLSTVTSPPLGKGPEKVISSAGASGAVVSNSEMVVPVSADTKLVTASAPDIDDIEWATVSSSSKKKKKP
jgi:hypothetical protein